MSKLPMFKDFVPEWMRFPILLLLPFIFQSSNPVFMNVAAQMMSDTALTNEDVMMLGFAPILGITVTFPLVFRNKFRFTTRTILTYASLGMIICGFLATKVTFFPLLLLICFVYGILKLLGTFECFSSMMMIITPNMHLAPFLAVVFLAVFGGVELCGLGSTYLSYLHGWEYASYALILAHCVVLLVARLLMKDFRFKPPMKLYGIDWLGMLLWGLFLLSLTAVFVYGETLDWLHSDAIRICCGIALLSLGGNLWRMTHVRHPYLDLQCFRYRNIWQILVIFFIVGVMLSSQTVLQNILTGSVLHFQPMNSVDLNWAVLAGIALGCWLGRLGLTSFGWDYKQLTLLSILFLTAYVAAMYFLVAPGVKLSHFILPSILSGVGHALVFVVLTTYVENNTPFEHRMMMLTALGLVRTGIASPIGAAMYGHLFKVEMGRNLALLGSDAHAGSMLHYGGYGEMVQGVVQQAIMVSLRNLFGLTVIIGVVTMLIILIARFNPKQYITLPTLGKIYKGIEES